MTDQLLHLTESETLRIVRDTPEELELEATWGSGGSPPPAHLHPAQDEEFIVESGELWALVDGEERRLRTGDMLVVSRGTPHKMWNPGGQPATAIWRTRPGGRTRQWFEEIDRLNAGGTRQPPLAELLEAVGQYSDVFVLAEG